MVVTQPEMQQVSCFTADRLAAVPRAIVPTPASCSNISYACIHICMNRSHIVATGIAICAVSNWSAKKQKWMAGQY